MLDFLTADTLQNSLSILSSRAEEYRKTSDRYRYVNSAQLIDRSLDIFKDFDLQNVGTRIVYSDKTGVKSTRHLIEFRMHDLKKDLLGSEVVPRLLLWNSYNGECSLKVSVGVYRMICSNGLSVGTDLFSQSAVHLHGSEIEQVLESFETRVTEALTYLDDTMVEDFAATMGVDLSAKEQVRMVNWMIQRNLISTRIGVQALAIIGNHRYRPEDSSNTLWSLYNILNEQMRHGGRSQLSQEVKNVDLMTHLITSHSVLDAS